MNRAEPHQLRGAVYQIDAREGGAYEGADAIEGELVDVAGTRRREKGLDDLTNHQELAEADVGGVEGARFRPFGAFHTGGSRCERRQAHGVTT